MKGKKQKKMGQNQKRNICFCLIIAVVLVACLGAYDYNVIQDAKNKVEQIAEKEMPLLIAEKNLAGTLSAAKNAAQEYVTSGDEFYEVQWQKQKAIFTYYKRTIEKTPVSGEIVQLLEKNSEWFAFVGNEIIRTPYAVKEFSQGQGSIAAQFGEIDSGYIRQIMAQEALIETLEHEVSAAEKTSNLLLGVMSLILAAASISSIIFLCKKNLKAKEVNILSKAV